MKTIAMGMVIMASLGGNATRNKEPVSLWLFFSDATSGAPKMARSAVDFVLARKGEVVLRPVLLVSDFRKLTGLSRKSPLVGVLEELKRLGKKELNVPLYDLQGLQLAKHLKLSRLPAVVLVVDAQAFVAVGDRVDLERLYGASK